MICPDCKKPLREALKWQPIDTAPRDGTLFIALTQKGVCRAQWSVVDWEDHPLDRIIKWWVNPDDVFFFEEPSDAPTHWMPLPAPPKGDNR